MSSLKNIGYFFSETLKSLRRNRLLSIATVSTVAICILILGMAVLITINAGNFMNRLESDLEMAVFVDNSLDQSDLKDLRMELEQMPGVKSVVFVSKEQALKELQAKFDDKDYDLRQTLGKNPLPNSFDVKAENPKEVAKLAQKIEGLSGVEKVNYGKGIVERLFQVTRWVRIISIAVIIMLALGAVFLIATTIRLAIFSRRKEIYLMKLIGATDWFVRWPFFIEGILLGSLGSLIAIALLALGYTSLLSNMQTAVYFIPLVKNYQLLINVYLSLFAAGAVLGMTGTYISVNRFINV